MLLRYFVTDIIIIIIIIIIRNKDGLALHNDAQSISVVQP